MIDAFAVFLIVVGAALVVPPLVSWVIVRWGPEP